MTNTPPDFAKLFQMDKKAWLLLIVLLLACGGLFLYMTRPDVAGFLYDDGMYLMAAKSILDGQGYRLTDMAGEPLFYKYPPLFPLFLAGMWLLNPHFPDNIFWLKTLNIALSLFSLAALFIYFHRQRGQSLLVSLGLIAILATNLRFIEMSVELMSEPLFLFASVLLVIAASRIQKDASLDLRQLGVLVFLSAAAFYTRTMALPLIMAVAVWTYWRTGLKNCLQYFGLTGLSILPWFLWSASRTDQTFSIGSFLIRAFQETYFQSFRMDLKYEYNILELYGNGVNELLGNLSVQVFPLLERLFLLPKNLMTESLILGLSFLMVFVLARRLFLSLKAKSLSLPGLYLAFYLSILPFWSFYRFYPRFIIVVLPFLLDFLIRGIQVIIQKPRLQKAVITLFLASGLASNLIHLQPFYAKPYQNTLVVYTEMDLWTDYKAAFDFLQSKTPPDSTLFTDNDSYFYGLNTGRKTTDFFVFLPKKLLTDGNRELTVEALRQWFVRKSEVNYEMLKRRSVDYVVEHGFSIVKNQYNNWMLARVLEHDIGRLKESHPKAFKPVFISPNGWIVIYEFNPEPAQSVSAQEN